MPDLSSHPAATFSSTTARDALIEQHRHYVYALARDISKQIAAEVDMKELIGYGLLGLVESAERFDARRGVSFTTFSYYRIRGAIFDGLHEMGFYPRTPRARLQFAANDALRTAADDEMAAETVTSQNVDDEIAQTQDTISALIPIFLLSLDTDNAARYNADFANAENQHRSGTFLLEQNELEQLTRGFIEELPEDCRRVIEEVYFKDASMTDVAEQMGVGRAWVSRLHARAIKLMRRQMQQHGLIDEE